MQSVDPAADSFNFGRVRDALLGLFLLAAILTGVSGLIVSILSWIGLFHLAHGSGTSAALFLGGMLFLIAAADDMDRMEK